MKRSLKNNAVGDLLKSYREACGFSQQQVADALGIDRSTYTYYELGNTTPSAPFIIKLSKIFNVSYTKFMDPFLKLESEAVLGDSGISDDLFDGEQDAAVEVPEPVYSLSKEEQSLLCMYRLLTPEQKKAVAEGVKKFNKENK